MAGWICLHRDIQNHWIFSDAERFKAWIDLIMLANHEENKFMINDTLITVTRGQLAWSQLSLSDRWKWTRQKTRTFLKLLQSQSMIDTKSNHHTTIITICNYSQYQDGATNKQPTDNQQITNQQPTLNQPITTDNNVNNVNNVNNKETGTNVPVVDSSQKKPKKEIFEIPDWLNEKAWAEFKEHRKSIKKPMTVTGEVKGSNILKPFSFEEQQQIIDYSIFAKYPGLYPDCLNKKQSGNNSNNNKNIDVSSFTYKPSIFKADFYDQSKIIEGELT